MAGDTRAIEELTRAIEELNRHLERGRGLGGGGGGGGGRVGGGGGGSGAGIRGSVSRVAGDVIGGKPFSVLGSAFGVAGLGAASLAGAFAAPAIKFGKDVAFRASTNVARFGGEIDSATNLASSALDAAGKIPILGAGFKSITGPIDRAKARTIGFFGSAARAGADITEEQFKKQFDIFKEREAGSEKLKILADKVAIKEKGTAENQLKMASTLVDEVRNLITVVKQIVNVIGG